jgi:hypothetical protein
VAYYRWDLGLNEVEVGHINAGQFVRNQIQLVVDQLDLELHVIELEEDLLAGFMVVEKNSAHQCFQVPVYFHRFQVLRGPPTDKNSVGNPRSGRFLHLIIRGELP